MGNVHTVVSGESLSLIAIAYGYEASEWPLIYDHPENADFRELRPDPDLIHPGDQVYVPLKDEPAEEIPPEPEPALPSVPVEAGRRHRFRLVGPQTRLQVEVRDGANAPHAFCSYTVEVGAVTRNGTTDADGLVDVQLPDGDDLATLTVWTASNRTEVWTLRIGHLEAVETTAGVQGRLNNLGYESGPVDGVCGPITQGAIRAFQTDHQLVVDGVCGPNTEGKLRDVYGC